LGSNFQTIADVEATAEEADELADALLAWLIETGVVPSAGCVSRNEVTTEGLEIVTGRNVFSSLTGDWWVTCPHCAWSTDPEDTRIGDSVGAWQDLQDTISGWHAGGSDQVRCPNCRRDVGLNDWGWSPPWGFGYLGFTFWNWPTFSPEFLAEVSERLGHRTVHPYGKL